MLDRIGEKKTQKSIIHNDESTSEDRLDREIYAKAFARLSEICDTPLVIGLYGSWGVGKTSLMKQIWTKIDRKAAHTIWFDAWMHQFDECPAIALMQTMVETLGIKNVCKNLIINIANAFGEILLKRIGNVSINDLKKIKKSYEEHYFQIRDSRIRLQEYFSELIEFAQKSKSKSKKRIICFIDDLDRCMPSQILNMLESLKLYLNQAGFVYFLGVDRQVLEKGIKFYYKDLDMSETNYLDKIVQLPFTIPPIAPESMENFISPLLSSQLQPCQTILVKGLGDNPRQIKRFINSLTLNHQLAANLNIPDYNPMILTILLLIQYRNMPLYNFITRKPEFFYKIKEENEETKTIYEEFLSNDDRLKDVLTNINFGNDISLSSYIYLTQAVNVSETKNKFDDRGELFNEALKLVVRHQQGSVSLLQRRLKIGYADAARLIDRLEDAGYVGPFDGSKAREVLIDEEMLKEMGII